MAGKFKIDQRAVRQMSREIEKEFAKNPVRVPVQGNARGVEGAGGTNHTTVNYGPVITINGDGAQIAWDNNEVNQTSHVQKEEVVTPGYEPVAQALKDILGGLSETGIDVGDQAMVVDESIEVLEEITKPEPDQGVVKRGLALVKGVLSPVATGLQEGISENAKQWAITGIKSLTAAALVLA
ncbi:hypothetical protein [Kocuria rosea]|uniref:hypothetical protein n=1 Tax=Kocuria rosea TaxID=1275 RepID=UPI00119D19DE|nr:hypothetical protein [Kocuria rosea]